MISSLLRLLQILVLVLTITSCNEYKCDQLKIRSLGTAQFRISYANHLNLADHELDSIQNSNPEFDLMYNDPKPELRKYLDALGFVDNNTLVLKKVDTLLSDTVIIPSFSKEYFSLFTSLDSRSEKTFLNITGSKCKDSLYLDNSLIRPRIRIVQIRNNPQKLVLVFWKSYFMNGDMFNMALFETI